MLPGHISTSKSSSPSLWRPAPHVIGPPTTEMTKLPPLELTNRSGEAHTPRLSSHSHSTSFSVSLHTYMYM